MSIIMWLLRLMTANPWAIAAAFAVAVSIGAVGAWNVRGWMADAAIVNAMERQQEAYESLIADKDAEIERRGALASSYEDRKAKRQEERIIYVEKPSDRDCVVDAEWVRAFSGRIAEGNASNNPR